MSLIPFATYSQHGNVLIALDDERMVPINMRDVTGVAPDENTRLLERPGTDDWTRRVVGMLKQLGEERNNTYRSYAEAITRYEDLGEALLRKAEEKDWCEEYDEFAGEWGLPTCKRRWTVRIDVTVLARTEDDAIEIVGNGVSLNAYDGDIVQEPSFYAEKG